VLDMGIYFRLIGIKNHRLITKQNDCNFIFHIQQAALLGLKESGQITVMQYRQAEEMLLKQYHKDIQTHLSASSDA
jgi:hypothetical protein